MTTSDTTMICSRCATHSPSGLYATRERTIRYVCFNCLDELEPAVVARYDGWREREELRAKRAKVARSNFKEDR